MSKVLHHKVVAALPSPLEPDSIYYVRSGTGFNVRITNGVGEVVAYSLNADTTIGQHIGATGTAHGLATADRAGFMSPDHAKFLEFFGGINNIGAQGSVGFGVGICPALPAGMTDMPGTMIKGHDNYGNYQFTDGSIMCWVPAFYYRWGSASSARYATYGANACDVVPFSAFPSVAAANVAGWALHRAFYDGGQIKAGVFVDKYQCSNNSGTASSVRNGDPLSSNGANNPFSGLTGSPANIYAGAIDAAKTRGADFFPKTIFIDKALALLSMAHAQASTSSAACAWYDATGVSNFPKGCNNNALRDANDTSVLYIGTGYLTAGKTGSGTPFAKTTHNGQVCGIADLNGNMWEISPGLTQLDGVFYALKTSARAANLTSGVTVATDAWGALGVAQNYTALGATYGELSGVNRNFAIGSASQVFSGATEGLDWLASCAGIPQLGGGAGSNLFGYDRFYDNPAQNLCPLVGGGWNSGGNAGGWAVDCYSSRASSLHHVGFRAALYLR